MLRKKDCALQHPYQTRAKARIMSDIKQVQEQMTTMMEAMMSIRKIMEVNVAIVVATSTTIEMDPIYASISIK